MIDLSTSSVNIAENTAPEEALALGVLSQAAHDLRRFHTPVNSLERQLYRDAYDWLTEDNPSWPYSFVNICKLLHVPPQDLRAELLADASLGWLGYWLSLGKRYGRSFRSSLNNAFRRSRSGVHTTLDDAPVYRLRHT